MQCKLLYITSFIVTLEIWDNVLLQTTDFVCL